MVNTTKQPIQKTYVSNKDESIRMFENDFLDLLSRVHFSVPLFIFLPAILFLAYRCYFVIDMSWLEFAGCCLGGVALWTFFEYAVHRFIFHYHPTSELGKRIHFITHGVHHDYPQDSKRLVMVPAISIPSSLLMYWIFGLVLGNTYADPTFLGFISAYLVYDMLHYAIHHLHSNNRWFKMLQEHHMRHHYNDPDSGYGFTSKVWDKVFDTDFK